jgi:hypothetical protein
MKCPKCGFDQPSDRFCANCGVDVALYVPQKRSFASYWRPGLLYAAAAALLIAGIWFLLGQKDRPDTQIVGIDRPTSVFKKPGPKSEPEGNPPAAVGGAASIPKPAPAPEPPAPAPAPPVPVLKPKATTFRVSLYEAAAGYLPVLLGAPVDGRLAAGIVRDEIGGHDFRERLRVGVERGLVTRIAGAVQTISTDDQRPNAFNFLAPDSKTNGELSLAFQLKAGILNEKESSVGLVGRRVFGREDSAQPPDVLNFQQELTIPLKLPAYVVGLVKGRNLVLLIEAVERP